MNAICMALRALGVSPHYRGYRYLAAAVELVIRNGTEGTKLTKAVYPAVAEGFHTGWRSVERDIRTAVMHAWEKRGREQIWAALGFEPEHRPTNGQFIFLLADRLSREARECRVGPLWIQFLVEDSP